MGNIRGGARAGREIKLIERRKATEDESGDAQMYGFPCQGSYPFRVTFQRFADWFTRLWIPEPHLYHQGGMPRIPRGRMADSRGDRNAVSDEGRDVKIR